MIYNYNLTTLSKILMEKKHKIKCNNLVKKIVKEIKNDKFYKRLKERGTEKEKKILIDTERETNRKVRKIFELLNDMDRRRTAKKDEDIRVDGLCKAINEDTELGLKLKKTYYEKFKKHILKVEKKGGNNVHFDILIYHTDGTTNQCEEKGTKDYSPIINDGTPPYENSVQFYNGPASKFTLCKKYLKLWYDNNVDNLEIKKKYDLPEIPSFEEWLIGGPNVMWGDPTSEYSKILKTNYRDLYPKKSMNGQCFHNINYRIKTNGQFELTEEDKKTLITEVQEIYRYVMNAKEVWLQTTGTTNSQISFRWFNKIEPQNIMDVEMTKGTDIDFKFILEDNTSFMGKMRWGNGCGFSCFRIDLK